MPFYTSDNPVVMDSHLKGAPRAPGAPGIEINFPLDPRHMLVMYDRHFFPELAGWHLYALRADSLDVLTYNARQVMQSYRQVYCSVSRFDSAVDLCWLHPQICDPSRERIQVVGGVKQWATEGVARGQDLLLGFRNISD